MQFVRSSCFQSSYRRVAIRFSFCGAGDNSEDKRISKRRASLTRAPTSVMDKCNGAGVEIDGRNCCDCEGNGETDGTDPSDISIATNNGNSIHHFTAVDLEHVGAALASTLAHYCNLTSWGGTLPNDLEPANVSAYRCNRGNSAGMSSKHDANDTLGDVPEGKYI